MSITIPLTNKKYGELHVVVDEEDYPLIKDHKWRVYKTKTQSRNNFYAQTDIKQDDGKWKTTYMHRLIMGNPKGKVIDHINHNGLDNQRSNLRVVNHRENRLNSPDVKHKRSWHGKCGLYTCVDENVKKNILNHVEETGGHFSGFLRDAVYYYLEREYPEMLK